MFPKELMQQKIWVGYRNVDNKAPLSLIHQDKPASSTNPQTWVYGYEAQRRFEAFGYGGIGCVLRPPYVGVDLDDCVSDAGELSSFARGIVNKLNSYTEYSPSGTGVHILCRGQIPRAYKDNEKGLEIYNTARYFTVTNKVLRSWNTLLPDRTKELLTLYPVQQKEFGKRNENGWLSKSLENLRPGNFHHEYIKIIGRLHYDRWTPSDIFALLKPHAERCQSSLEALQQRINSITQYKNTVTTIGDIPEESGTDLLNQKFKRDWVVQPFFPKGKLCLIAGIGGTGKSWLLLDLAIEAARGGVWLGAFPLAFRQKVLYIDQERSKDETGARIKQLCKAKGLTELPNVTFSIGSSIRLNLDRSYEAFKKTLQNGGYNLVLVDSLVKFHTADDNSRQALMPIFDRLHTLRNELGITFVLLEHEGKSVLSEEKRNAEPNIHDTQGSALKAQAIESGLTIRERGDRMGQAFHTKSTCGMKGDPFKFEIVDTIPNEATEIRVI